MTKPSTGYIILMKEGIFINTQYKKGVLELLILLMIEKKDMYGYEGTIYTILKILTNESLFETYTKESTEGPIRKYYHLTAAGKITKDVQLKEWKKFSESVGEFIRKSETNE